MAVAAVDDVQRAVGVGGQAAGPERAPGQRPASAPAGRASADRCARPSSCSRRIRGRRPSVWRSANTSPGSRTTTIVVAKASRTAASRSSSPGPDRAAGEAMGTLTARGPPSSAGHGLGHSDEPGRHAAAQTGVTLTPQGRAGDQPRVGHARPSRCAWIVEVLRVGDHRQEGRPRRVPDRQHEVPFAGLRGRSPTRSGPGRAAPAARRGPESV